MNNYVCVFFNNCNFYELPSTLYAYKTKEFHTKTWIFLTKCVGLSHWTLRQIPHHCWTPSTIYDFYACTFFYIYIPWRKSHFCTINDFVVYCSCSVALWLCKLFQVMLIFLRCFVHLKPHCGIFQVQNQPASDTLCICRFCLKLKW